MYFTVLLTGVNIKVFCSPATAEAGSWETTTLLKQVCEEWSFRNHSWARPKRRITELLFALHFVQSSSGLYKPSLRQQNKATFTYPSQQPESAPFKTLVLSWRLCHTKALALSPSVKQLPFYTELTLQRLLGLYRSAKPSHRGCWVKMSCSHLDWKMLFLPKETFIHEEHEWCYILHLTSLTDLLKLVFPGAMDTILYS